MPTLTLTDYFCAFIGLFLLVRLFNLRQQRPSLPPGPKGLPLIGNILDMPSQYGWFTFAEWAKKYGDVCSVKIFGQPLIILNSYKAAVDMLDKKGSIYSDRPMLPMAGDLVGWKYTLILLPYGHRFRSYRRLMHKLIGSYSSVRQFFPAEELEAQRFVSRVLQKPEHLSEHIRKMAGAVILRIIYGYEVKEEDDPFVKLADEAVEQFSLSSAPGAWLIDVLPILRHIPRWFPGAGFKNTASVWAATLQDMVELPHAFAKHQIASGKGPISFTSELLEEQELTPDEEFNVKWSAASLYSGGADTTVSAIYSFFLAMTLYPDVQKKAQAELDTVIGANRLPTFADRENLPYINALVKEVLRWNSVAPLALAHRVSTDDVHDGHFIPKGSYIIPNIWFMLHDPRVYANPMEFNPDRFISSEGVEPENDPRSVCFGFGRRICPGLNLADTSIFISCAMSLAVLNISKAVENGVVVEPVHESTSGTISHPKPFKCSIRARSAKTDPAILSTK